MANRAVIVEFVARLAPLRVAANGLYLKIGTAGRYLTWCISCLRRAIIVARHCRLARRGRRWEQQEAANGELNQFEVAAIL